MKNKFKTPKMDSENVVSFTCSDQALEPILELLDKLFSLGQMGSSREVTIDWDGDGKHQVNNISVNGMNLDNWEKEWERLKSLKND